MGRNVGLAALAALASGAAISNASASRAPLATFATAHGWLVAQAGPDNPSLVIAVTRPAAVVHPVALFGSFKKLSRRGILVWVETVGRGRKGFPNTTAFPPQLRRLRIERAWEGQPAPNIQQRTWVGSVHGWDLDVRVFFATQHPSAALLTRAQAELTQLRLP
jgi:hypothetical protein